MTACADYIILFDSLFKAYLNSPKKRFIVSVGGCSRSGKTTLAERIRKDLNSDGIECIIVSMDNWLLDIKERRGDETVRERYSYSKIVDALTQISNGDAIYPPMYDQKTRSIINQRNPVSLSLNEKGVCIADGVVALDIPELRRLADFKIFVEVNDDLRRGRLESFYTEYKKCELKEAIKIIEARESEEVSLIKQTKRYAEVIYEPKGEVQETGIRTR